MSTALIETPRVIAIDDTPTWVELLATMGTDTEPEFFWLSADVDEIDDETLALRGASL